ncbi:hypothetical protein GGI35DRAFT_44785 [Trichoderma velutinum]
MIDLFAEQLSASGVVRFSRKVPLHVISPLLTFHSCPILFYANAHFRPSSISIGISRLGQLKLLKPSSIAASPVLINILLIFLSLVCSALPLLHLDFRRFLFQAFVRLYNFPVEFCQMTYSSPSTISIDWFR